jgi:anthranilate/para-aminobenzoate synthase component I
MTMIGNLGIYPVGGGIIWDSHSREEWDEAQLKSKIIDTNLSDS